MGVLVPERKPPLTGEFRRKGWRPGVFDICWLACESPGHVHELVDGRTIVLCVPHIRELEETSGSPLGYTFANPPENHPEGTWWPWVEYYEEAMQWGLEEKTA